MLMLTPMNGIYVKRYNRGFSLLEVLIAVVVLSLGLLGFAATLGISLRSNESANYRTQATNLAYQILDRMRANRPAAAAYRTGFTDMATAYASAGSLALADLGVWKQEIERVLPVGQGQITINTSGVVLVAIRWVDNRAALVTADQTMTFNVRTQL